MFDGLFEIHFPGVEIYRAGIGVHNYGEQPLIAFFGDDRANPLPAFFWMMAEPVMTPPALNNHVIQIKPQLGIFAFGEDVRDIADGAVNSEGADTPAAVTEDQGTFQEAVEPIVFFLLEAFAGKRSFFSHS